MTREECLPHLERLYRGNRRLPSLTPDRISAVYERFRHIDASVFSAAVDDLLMDPSMPSGEKIADSVERVSERRRKRAVEQDNNAAREFFTRPVETLFDREDTLWARCHHTLILLIVAGRVRGEDVVSWNEQIAAAFDRGQAGEMLEDMQRIASEAPHGSAITASIA